MGVIVDRLGRMAEVEAEFWRGCDHVVEAHSSGAGLGVCGLHPELGLMCDECGACHAAEVHRVLRCDYCCGSFDAGDVYRRVWVGLLPAAPVKVAGLAELLALVAVAFVAWGVPMCCGRGSCRALADAEIDAVQGSHGV